VEKAEAPTETVNIDMRTTNNQTSVSGSSASVIREFKQLLDDGIITQEEFDAKKKQLLGF
jgi:predicted Zn-dependent peptidase